MTKSRICLLLLVLFFISNIFLLLNYQGIYWDDWVAYNQSPITMNIFFGMIQHGIKGDFYLVLSKYFNHVYLFRLFVVFAYALIGYFTYKILLSIRRFSVLESCLISFLSLIIPIYSSLVSIAIVPFVFPILLFYIAFYMLTKYYETPNKSLKFLILMIFFFSFNTNSLLVFYAIVILYVFYRDNNKFNVANITQFLYKRIDFIMLPIVFYIFKVLFSTPYGLYSGYNSISMSFISIYSIVTKTFGIMILYMFKYIATNVCFVLVTIVVALFISFKLRIKENIFTKNKKILLLLGIFLFILAVFPYAAVGKQPVISGWNSRFSLLLGISLSMLYIVTLASMSNFFGKYKNTFFVFSLTFLAILFMGKNISVQYKQNIDWFYQIAMEENFKNSKIIKNNSTFVATVQLNDCLYAGRNLSFYEQNGRMKKVFGQDNRFMVEKLQDIENYKKYKAYKQYNFSSWQYSKPIYLVIKKNSNINANSIYMAKMLYYQIFNKKIFRQMAKKLIVIKYKVKKNV